MPVWCSVSLRTGEDELKCAQKCSNRGSEVYNVMKNIMCVPIEEKELNQKCRGPV